MTYHLQLTTYCLLTYLLHTTYDLLPATYYLHLQLTTYDLRLTTYTYYLRHMLLPLLLATEKSTQGHRHKDTDTQTKTQRHRHTGTQTATQTRGGGQPHWLLTETQRDTDTGH